MGWWQYGEQEMLTYKDFRHIALGMEGAIESVHMAHPDFRVNGRIFATLHPDHLWGMVKLNPDQQQEFVREDPVSFVPENGAWGLQGCTKVRLDVVDEEKLGEAITLAWQEAIKNPRAGRSKPRRFPRRVSV
jgi:hypothetical protein